jgi:hypothetical protein
MEAGPQGLLALAEAERLREMFEDSALQAAERRIAHSIDNQDIDRTMYFLEVYRFVNGGDVLLRAPMSPPSTDARAAND